MKNKPLSEMTPQEIRQHNRDQKSNALAYDIRKRFKTEYAYQALTTDEKNLLRRAVLQSWGYDFSKNSTRSMRSYDMRIRQLYHRDLRESIKDDLYIEIFEALKYCIGDLGDYLRAIADNRPVTDERFDEFETVLNLSNPNRRTIL